MSELKNCLSCRHGHWESVGDCGEYTYFACDKRVDDGYNDLDNNLSKEAYRKRYKRCFEPLIDAVCINCKESEKVIFEPKSDYECFSCWQEGNKLDQGVNK